MWIRTCVVKYSFRWKLLPHTVHSNGFSLVWMALCLVSARSTWKCLPHVVHSNGFLSAWMQICLFRNPLSLKLLPHMVHSNGFSPLWIRKCLLRQNSRLKPFPHTIHWNCFSSAWVVRCMVRLCIRPKFLPHTEHWNGFSPVWTRRWLVSLPSRSKRLPHIVHWNGFSPICLPFSPLWMPSHATGMPLSHWMPGSVVTEAAKDCSTSGRTNVCSTPRDPLTPCESCPDSPGSPSMVGCLLPDTISPRVTHSVWLFSLRSMLRAPHKIDAKARPYTLQNKVGRGDSSTSFWNRNTDISLPSERANISFQLIWRTDHLWKKCKAFKKQTHITKTKQNKENLQGPWPTLQLLCTVDLLGSNFASNNLAQGALVVWTLLGACRPQGSLFEPNFRSQGSIFG